MPPKEALQAQIATVEKKSVLVMRNINRFAVFNVDMVFPHIILTFCLRGSAKAMFDMKLYTHSKYDIALLLPGHIMRPIECTDDYQYTAIYISAKLFDDLKLQTFSHDYQKFKYAPLCSLTEEQANRLLAIAEQLEVIAGYTEQEMPHRYQALLAQLAVGYEFLNLFRKEQDKQWANNRQMELYNRFCELVVAHYRESREIQYYAALLHLTPKYLSSSIRSVAGMSPAQWIEQYVITQAKRLIGTYPTVSLKEIAYMLGFDEPTSFYRYFKHATGMTANNFRKKTNTNT